ncbi:MAG: dihydroxy-acid dehydratase family protein [Alphaproteobacteria bacterium]|jgi:dihydroxy-acid dehydratase|nr:dihydroxy-acid dehydratase family protein [Alphaproteobacteria bacterium]
MSAANGDGRKLDPRLRSQRWFDDPSDPGMTALYIERYMNWGVTREELQSGKPMIGVAQTGSDLSPCNRIHTTLEPRIRDGIRDMGGIPFVFPTHPIQESGKRPTAALDRNLAYLGLVEILQGYPIDGVVLTGGCDKVTPFLLMAAATVDIPAIMMSGGPMLDGHWKGRLAGSGTILWEARERHAAGEIEWEEFIEMVAASARSPGHCNTMGTALSTNSLAEALGMALPGSAAIPAPYKERGQAAYETGRRIVDMVWEELKPSTVLTRDAFLNAIAVNTAIGGSTNCPIHLNAIARHAGVNLSIQDWEDHGYDLPLLVNCQPAGEYLGEGYYRAGGVPAVVNELMKKGRIKEDALTVNGKTMGENCRGAEITDQDVIRTFDNPLLPEAGFLNMKGNLFDSAIMKTSVISDEFRARFLAKPGDENAFEGRVILFEGPEDYHDKVNDPALNMDETCILVMRGSGPIGYPGSAEVVNMQPSDALIKAGVRSLPCIGDGRQSGTSGSPSILNGSPESAAGGGLALLRMGDMLRVDLNKRSIDIMIDDAELERRRGEAPPPIPESQTPWQEIYRAGVGHLSEGAVLEDAVKYRGTAKNMPRHSH